MEKKNSAVNVGFEPRGVAAYETRTMLPYLNKKTRYKLSNNTQILRQMFNKEQK